MMTCSDRANDRKMAPPWGCAIYPVRMAGACFGRAEAIIKQRERIKRQTIQHRRWQYRNIAA